MELWILLALLIVEQFTQVIVQCPVIDLTDHALFLRRQGRAQISGIDHIQQSALVFPVPGQFRLKGAGNIREVALAGIMQQAGQDQPVRPLPGSCFPGTNYTVLGH